MPVDTPTTDAEWLRLSFEAASVFKPRAPVNEESLFAGRVDQIRRVIEAVGQIGLHAVLFGERGVGKTSLANVLSQFLGGRNNTLLVATRVNCESADSFDSVWRKSLRHLPFSNKEGRIGFNNPAETKGRSALDLLGAGSPVTTDDVRRLLGLVGENVRPILIFDEFDRLSVSVRRTFADLIKTLSDQEIRSTLLLVGVAETVDQLIEDHASVSRALVQILMPRMTSAEIHEIIDKGLPRIGMTIEPDAKSWIVLLSQGLPHYTHLVSLHAVQAACDARSMTITLPIVEEAIKKAIKDADQSTRTAYHMAIRSARKDALFADVLLACALAPVDDLGSFAPQDVRGPLCSITSKKYDIPNFAQHLNEFADQKRGKILRKEGPDRRKRYHFSDPLMQPYVVMEGMASGRIPDDL
jgi:Cdc6-like AAA superfamily ATPase